MQEKILNQEELREEIFNESLMNAQLNSHEHNPTSEHLEQYLKMMSYNDIRQCNTYKSQIIASLSNRHSFNIDTDRNLKISVIESSRDSQYALLEVHYNKFEFYIWLLNVDEESPSHKIEKSHSGNFSTVYHTIHNNKNIAIKCTTFQNKTFQKVFRSVLLEYLVFQMTARLNCGPAMPKIFSFDLVIFKDCIQFSMEFCSHKLKPGPALTNDLVSALRNLHSINIIHFDIKPQNICFSQETGKALFIDFGLHSMVREEVGYKSMTQFGGSLLYCSEQMNKIFMQGSGYADLYYNDALCLAESLKEINSDKRDMIQSKVLKVFIQSQFYFLSKLKCLILQINPHEYSGSRQEQLLFLINRLGNRSIHSFFDFIFNINYSIFLENLIGNIQKHCPQIDATFITKTLFRRRLDNQTTKEDNLSGVFQKRIIFIKKLNKLRIIQEQTPHILEDYITLLANVVQAKRLQKRVYYRLFAQMQQINCWKVSQKQKQQQTIIFNKIWLHIQLFETIVFEEKQKKCFYHICEYIFKQDKLDKALYPIIKYSLLSAMHLKIYTAPQLQMVIKNIMRKQCSTVVKIRIFIHILSCTSWISECTQSVYREHCLNEIAFSEMSQYLSNLKNQSPNIQEEINIVKTILSHGPIKTKVLAKRLSYLQQQLNNRITKFYTSVMQQEQLQAQIYVYILCNVIDRRVQDKNDFSFGIFNKLLNLQSYRKQAQLCIYDYYEHIISYVINKQGHQKSPLHTKQTSHQLEKIFVYNYINQPQMNYGKFYYVKDNIAYCLDKDLSKMTNEQAFLYRGWLMDKYYRLMFVAPLRKQKLDLQSLIAAAKLSEMHAFIPQLYQKASLKSYLVCIIPKYFEAFCSQILDYSQIQEYASRLDHNQGQFQNLLSFALAFMGDLKCLSCKFHCMTTFWLAFGSLQKQMNIIEKQQYILEYLVWRMKQQDLSKLYVAHIIIKVCCFPDKQYVYETFLVQYIINNNVPPSIFYQLGDSAAEQMVSHLLGFLWERRYITTECGLPLYFRFILYLCRHLQQCKFLDPCYTSLFASFLNLFLKDIDYQDFFSFNSNILCKNKQVFNNEKYAALYFSTILVNPYQYLKQFVHPAYYAYCFKSCPFLDVPCKIIVQSYSYVSFIYNQMQYSHLKQRRKFYLTKKEFRFHIQESNEHIKELIISKLLKDRLLVAKRMLKRDKRPSLLLYNMIKHKTALYFRLGK